MTTPTFTVLRATVTTWGVEPGTYKATEYTPRVVEFREVIDILLTEERAGELLATGRRWVNPWRSIDYSMVPATTEEV